MRRDHSRTLALFAALAPLAGATQITDAFLPLQATSPQPSLTPTPAVANVWVIHVPVEIIVRKVAVDFAREMDEANRSGASLIVVELGADQWRLDLIRDMADVIQKSTSPVAVLLNDNNDKSIGIGPLILGLLASGSSIMPGLVIDHVPMDDARTLAPADTDWPAIEADLIARLHEPLDSRNIDPGLADALVKGRIPVWATRTAEHPRPKITLTPPPNYKPPADTPAAGAPPTDGAAPAGTPQTPGAIPTGLPGDGAASPPVSLLPPDAPAAQPGGATPGTPDTSTSPQPPDAQKQIWIAVMLPDRTGATAMRMEWGLSVGLRLVDNTLTAPDQIWVSRGLPRVLKTERFIESSMDTARTIAGVIFRNADMDLEKIAFTVECRALEGRPVTDAERYRAGEKALTMFKSARANLDRWRTLVGEYPELLTVRAARPSKVLGGPPDMQPIGDLFKGIEDRLNDLEAQARKNARR